MDILTSIRSTIQPRVSHMDTNHSTSGSKRLTDHSEDKSQQPYKIRRITSSLPQRLEVNTIKAPTSVMSPQDYLVNAMSTKGLYVGITPSPNMENYFVEHNKEQVESYGQDVVNAIRSRDIAALRAMYLADRSLQCSNRFGESLIHMACRRGFTDVAKFLVNEAGVSLQVRDDYGRTPLHDACWTAEPNMDLMDLIMEKCPELLLVSDKRGHAPLQYVRREHWDLWVIFLQKREALLCSAASLYKKRCLEPVVIKNQSC